MIKSILLRPCVVSVCSCSFFLFTIEGLEMHPLTTHTHMHARTHKSAHTHTLNQSQTNKQTHTHARTHTKAQAHTLTHTAFPDHTQCFNEKRKDKEYTWEM